SAGALLPQRLWGDSVLRSPSVYLAMTLLVLLGVWLVDINVMRTKLGRAFRMIREDEVVAQSFGIDVTRYKLLAFILSGAIAGLAGLVHQLRLSSVERRRADDVEDEEPVMPNLVAVAHRAPAIAASDQLLAVEGVTVRFGGLLAVDDVSLTARRGTVVGIIGPNGAGKSTFFNAISGFVAGARGRVVLDGVRLDEMAPHLRTQQGLGRTFQLV